MNDFENSRYIRGGGGREFFENIKYFAIPVRGTVLSAPFSSQSCKLANAIITKKIGQENAKSSVLPLSI